MLFCERVTGKIFTESFEKAIVNSGNIPHFYIMEEYATVLIEKTGLPSLKDSITIGKQVSSVKNPLLPLLPSVKTFVLFVTFCKTLSYLSDLL